MPEISTQRISTILGYRVEGEEDLQALAKTLGKTNQETEQSTESSKQLRLEKRKLSEADREKIRQSRLARTNQMNMNRAMEDAKQIIRQNTLQLENLKLEYEQGNVSSEEYRVELQKLMQQMEQLDVPTAAIPRRMRVLNREMKKAESTAARSAGSIRGTTFAFNSFAQILQDLPFGLIAISNNIPQAATGFAQLETKAEGAAGAFSELLSFATGPGGWLIVASTMISVMAVLIPKMDLFGEKTKKAADANKALQSAVKSGIGDFLNNLSDQSQIDAISKALEKLYGFDTVSDQIKSSGDQLQKLIDGLDKAKIKATQFYTAQADATQASNTANKKALEYVADNIGRQHQLNEAVKTELEHRLAVAQANKLVAQALKELGLQQEKLNKDEVQLSTDVPKIENEILDPGSDKFKSYQKQFDTLWSNIKEDGIQNFSILKDFETGLLKEIKNDAVLTEYQKQQLRTQITERFAQRRNEIEQKNAEQIMQLQDQIVNKKEQIAGTLAGTLSGLLTTAFSKSKAAALASIALEKGYSIAKVLIKGIEQSSRLMMQGTANLVTPGFQGLGFAQIAAAGKIKTMAAINAGLIAAQGIAEGAQAIKNINNGGQGGSGVSNASYRYNYQGYNPGSDFNQAQQQAQNTGPKTLILKDRAGKFLTRLQQAQDREGGNDYLVKSRGNG